MAYKIISFHKPCYFIKSPLFIVECILFDDEPNEGDIFICYKTGENSKVLKIGELLIDGEKFFIRQDKNYKNFTFYEMDSHNRKNKPFVVDDKKYIWVND